MNRQALTDFFLGLLLGLGLSASMILFLAVYHPEAIPLLTLSDTRVALAGQATDWLAHNFGLSLLAFGITLVFYLLTLNQLARALKNQRATLEHIVHLEHLIDIWISLFFGIGVIWTAIGMRSALLYALGELNDIGNATTVLARLVEGGILTSLSTTILGGAGGYLMRLYKTIRYGAMLNRFYTEQEQDNSARIEKLLEAIRNAVDDLPRSHAPSLNAPERYHDQPGCN